MLGIKWDCKAYIHKKMGQECELLEPFGMKKGSKELELSMVPTLEVYSCWVKELGKWLF